MKVFGWFCFCMAAVALAAGFMSAAARPAYAAGSARDGLASWYSRAECCTAKNPNALMANGQPLRDDRYTCASWDYPLGAVVRVTAGARSVECVVTDRGPARRLTAQGRIVDLTRAAFQRLAPLDRGLVRVTVREVRP